MYSTVVFIVYVTTVNVLLCDICIKYLLLHFPIGCPIPQHLMVLIRLRCMATGGHHLTISDCYEVSQTSVSRCLRTVTPAIGEMARDSVKMPSGMDVVRVMEEFRDIAGMPGIVGAIDCTHSYSAPNLRKP